MRSEGEFPSLWLQCAVPRVVCMRRLPLPLLLLLLLLLLELSR
jgi:hypothetical protein